MDDFEIVKIFCIFAKRKLFMSYCYIPNPYGFKHYTYDKYKIDFYKNTAILMWSNTVDEDYDAKTSYKATKTAILDRLRDNPILSSKFILLQEIFPASYSKLPVEKETMELYVNFKRNDLTAKEKKAEIRRFLDNM